MIGLELTASFMIELSAAAIQGVAGFGMNIVAGPLLVLLEPKFVPVPVLFCAMIGSTMVLARDRQGLDRRTVLWGTIGRLPGTAAGAGLVMILGTERIGIALGVLVICAVALSVARPVLTPSATLIVGTGVVSGVFSTVAGLGGVPFGLVFQGLPAQSLRATVSALALVGSALSLAALAVSGEVTQTELALSLPLLPGLAAGFFLSSRLVRRANQVWVRRIVLCLATTAAVAVIFRGLLVSA